MTNIKNREAMDSSPNKPHSSGEPALNSDHSTDVTIYKVSVGEIPFVYTEFPDTQARKKERCSETWGQFVNKIQHPPEFMTKSDALMLKLADFGNVTTQSGCLRHDANVTTVYGIEADYDAGAYSIERAGQLLESANIEALIVSTASYTNEAPRWRLFLPFESSVSGSALEMRAVRNAALKKIEELLGIKFAPESFNLSQSYYFGKVQGVEYVSYHSGGEAYVPKLEDDPFETLPDVSHQPLDHQQMIASIFSGENYHQSMIRLAASYVASGVKRDHIIAMLKTIFDSSPLKEVDPKWLERFEYIETAVDSALAKGFAPTISFPDLGQNGKPLGTRANLAALIDGEQIDVRFDLYTRRLIAWYQGQELHAHIDALLVDKAVQVGLPKPVVAEQLDAIAMDRSINKPLQWLQSLPKAGGDPLQNWLYDNWLIDPCEPFDAQWAYIAFKRWLISTCASADQLKHCPRKDAIQKFEHVLVLVGPQGKKKTTAFRMMLPPEIRGYFTEGATLHTDNKDSVLKVTGAWICELGELDATFRRSDIASLKSFLSSQADEIRMPYDRRAIVFPRRTTYLATVNEGEFLNDLTGGRRFWPVKIDRPLTYSEEFGAALWAQAWHWYLSGEQWWLTASEEMLAQTKRMPHSSNHLLEPLKDAFDFECGARQNPLKPNEILKELGITGKLATREYKQLNAALESLGIGKASKAQQERRYLMPPSFNVGFEVITS